MAVKGDKMRSRRKAETTSFVPPKVSGPDPREFPVGSVQSRAAARQIVVAYLKQERAEIETEFGKDAPQILFVMEELNALARQYVLLACAPRPDGSKSIRPRFCFSHN
jgi:hypothetical protein